MHSFRDCFPSTTSGVAFPASDLDVVFTSATEAEVLAMVDDPQGFMHVRVS